MSTGRTGTPDDPVDAVQEWRDAVIGGLLDGEDFRGDEVRGSEGLDLRDLVGVADDGGDVVGLAGQDLETCQREVFSALGRRRERKHARVICWATFPWPPRRRTLTIVS